MKHKCGVIWFRKDLRCYDNEALSEAMQSCEQVLGIYVFDERLIAGVSPFGFPRWSLLRLEYAIRMVKQLQEAMQALGGRLIVRTGRPEEEVLALVHHVQARWVFCNRERTQEEVAIQDQLEERLWQIGREMRYSRGKMLIHTADLPFPVTHVPDSFATFRKEVSFLHVRDCFDTPERIASPRVDDFEDHYPASPSDQLDLVQLQWIDRLASMDDVLGDVDADEGLPLSPALSMGLLSPKHLYHTHVEAHPEVSMLQPSDLVTHLLLRDHKRLMGKKYGDLIFHLSGVKEGYQPLQSHTDEMTQMIKCARTGRPLIDAAIKCLKYTGYLSPELRHVVADYLIYEMKADWRCGAELFECYLLDYDPCSNYVNWQQEAGVGPDSERRHQPLNIAHQTRSIDPDGSFCARWLDHVTT